MRIYIIRHGETALNAKGVMQGWIDEPLNDNGRLLATITGQGMQDITFDACISSPLNRATETAEIILRESGNKIGLNTDNRIKEISFGTREKTTLSEKEAKEFFTNPFIFGRFPGGESVQDVCERTQAFLKELMAYGDEGNYLVSTHGCALRAMTNWLFEDPTNYWRGHVPYNCCVNIIEVHGGKAEIIAEDKIYYDPKYCVDRYMQR